MRTTLSLVLTILFLVGCSSDTSISRSVVSPVNDGTTSTQATSGNRVVNPAAIGRPAQVAPDVVEAFNGRTVPTIVTDSTAAAALFAEVQEGLRAESDEPDAYADLGHTEQLVIRQLVRNDEWIESFLSELSAQDRAIAELHLTARRELGLLHTGDSPSPNIPAWTIVDPEPLDVLIGHYKRAGEATGIDWQILAGINLVETGMGRIRGASSAGAQGPMQFLPTTWDEVSEGGDINDPGDAIDGAARYLVQRGGLEDIRQGLFGYNNSDNYVNAVLAYADLLELDERTIRGFYNWEIYVGTSAGTLWLPVGFLAPEATPAVDYLQENPWALTLG